MVGHLPGSCGALDTIPGTLEEAKKEGGREGGWEGRKKRGRKGKIDILPFTKPL